MASYAAVQAIDPRLEALDNLANATHLVEFDLELVDFAQNGSEAGDFGVGHLDRVTCAVVLHLGCCLCLLRELSGRRQLAGHYHTVRRLSRGRRGSGATGGTYIVPSLLDRVH
jgi:hypothetical protein